MVDSVPELVKRHCGRLNRFLQLLGDDDRAVGGCREVGALVDASLDGGSNGRIRVTDHDHAEAVMEVGVLVAVDVPDA